MKFNKLTASFGKLDNATLSLGEGLTVITAPNEGGKSTWAGFLKAMLYGIDSKSRDKKGFLADKNRYQPWSGKPLTGQLELTWGGRDITLRRQSKGNSPFSVFSATYTGTESAVAGLAAADCGFALTGVEREVYERSAFLGAGSHAVTASPELERRIAALVTTGEEEFSFTQVENQLKEWGRLRRLNKSVGVIPKLEIQLEEVETALSKQGQLNGDIATASGQQVALKERLTQLDGQLEQHRRWELQRKNQKYTAAKSELDTAQHQLDELKNQMSGQGEVPSQDRLRHWQGELAVLKSIEKELRAGEEPIQSAESALEDAKKAGEDSRFGGLNPADALELARREISSYGQSGGQLKKLARHRIIDIVGYLISCGVSIGAGYYYNQLQELLVYVMLGLFTIIGLIGLGYIAKEKKQLIAEMSGLLTRYELENIEDLTPLAEDYALRQQNLTQAEGALQAIQGQQKQLEERRESIEIRLLEFVQQFSPEVQGLVGCSAAISLALQRGEALSVAQAKLAGAQRLFQSVEEEGGAEPQSGDVIQPSRPLHEISAQRGAAADELRRVEDNLSQLLGRQQASGDPLALAAEREGLIMELDRRNTELTAIQTALTALQNANIRLQERFSPQLNQKAGGYLAYLTGGRYESLSLNRDMEGAATQAGDVLPHSALALSTGTADQLYFALRLAVCDLCLPSEEGVPLVLDDALLAFDQTRMERALDLLCDLAQHRQIILFSCHSREAEYLASRDGVRCVEI